MSGSAAPYQFDSVFAIDAPETKKKKEAPSFDQAAIDAAAAAAREEGRREGREEALREAEADMRRRIAESTAALVAAMERLTERRDAEEKRSAEEAVQIGVAAARKLSSTLIEREPLAEIEQLLRECVGWAAEAPHLVVRVNDETAEPLRKNIDAIAAEKAFRGRLVVLPDPELQPGDGRIDWADGGAVRERAKIDEAISDAVERYLATRPAGA